jgi:hypothetical protein
MVRHELLRHDVSLGAETLAGVITIVYCDAACRGAVEQVELTVSRAVLPPLYRASAEDPSGKSAPQVVR